MYDIFSLPDFKFPSDFVWGSATAGHQIEGDNTNAQKYHQEVKRDIKEKSGKACNHYELFREDVDMISDLGHQAYRCSLEWSRIEPTQGEFSQAALEHYKELLVRVKERGMKTFVTLIHFTRPQWHEELGGFNKVENIAPFLRYVEKAVRYLDEFVDYWLVLNEETHLLHGVEIGFNRIRAHAQAYHVIKGITDTPVSSAHLGMHSYPCRYYDELDRTMTLYEDFRINGCVLHAIQHGELIAPLADAQDCPEAKGAMDFWAINHYTRHLVNSRSKSLYSPRFPHKKLRMIDMDFSLEEMFPEGLTSILERFNDGRDVWVTENGCSCADDRFRIVFLALYLSAVNDAIQRGVNLKGYLYWSTMDNYEWGSFIPRFGMVHVDFETFLRTPKPSAYFFKEMIEQNGFSQEILRRYLHEMPSLVQRSSGAPSVSPATIS
ncbi:glycoside hydrolase family 1 protein [Coraliomargarita parva]|uniref:glycoside hydrolase family 1 protein n=1 Tax=Coraliomargarita parva TaxID=3014050 RepID=UPI0022B461EC|nr:family 1 glycosylhydrolase [Coraliomargarita parva]